MVFFRPGDLLVLDEPEQRLDTTKRALVGDLLIHRRQAGDTLLVACHDPVLTADRRRRARPARAVNDRERLEDVERPAWRQGLRAAKNMGYAVYVTVLLASTYGFTVARAVFATSGPAWIDDHVLTLPTAVIGVGLFVASLALARWAGRTRGPVVPPLPWTDLVASSDVDRARSLRRWWTYAFVGGLVGGAILGAVIGGGVWASGAGSAGWFVGAVPIGAVAGWLLARMWLEGQVAPDTSGTATLARVVRPAAGSCGVATGRLRSHGVRSARWVAGVGGRPAGGPLEVASPVTRGRRLRLQAADRAVVVRRDILGLRRAPGAFWTGPSSWSSVGWGRVGPHRPAGASGTRASPWRRATWGWGRGPKGCDCSVTTPARTDAGSALSDRGDCASWCRSRFSS
jgi:hypothetical protein